MRLQHAFFAALLCAAGLAFGNPIQPGTTPAATRQAIQAAIDAAAAQSPAGTVTLGTGTFEIDAQLMITNGVALVGQGWNDTTIRQTANGQRVATLAGGARLQGVTATGGRLTAGWTHGPGLLVEDGTVSWCRIIDNVSTGRNVHGGGVNITKGTVDHCIVAFNQAGTYTSSGGGIGTYNTSGTFVIDTCLVHGNTASVTDTAGKGGGICVNMGNPTVTIRNTTIAGNSLSGSGGGFYNGSYGNKVTLVNTLVAGNAADSDADSHDGTLASGSSNNLLGGDPRFVASGNSDYHLASGSPAINAGTAWAGIGDALSKGPEVELASRDVDLVHSPLMGRALASGACSEKGGPGENGGPRPESLRITVDGVEVVGELLGLREAGKLAQGEAHNHLHLGVGGEARRILRHDCGSARILGKLLALVVNGKTHGVLLVRYLARSVQHILSPMKDAAGIPQHVAVILLRPLRTDGSIFRKASWQKFPIPIRNQSSTIFMSF